MVAGNAAAQAIGKTCLAPKGPVVVAGQRRTCDPAVPASVVTRPSSMPDLRSSIRVGGVHLVGQRDLRDVPLEMQCAGKRVNS